jgi:hypothetical protein
VPPIKTNQFSQQQEEDMNFTKETANPLFWIGILFLTVLAYVYYMNEGYTDASGSKIDASGNILRDASGANVTLSLADLIKALSFSNKTGSPEDALNPPIFTSSTNVLPVAVGEGKTILDKETENRLSKNIVTQLKDELLAQRATTNVSDGCSSGSGSGSGSCASPSDSCSDSCSQGSDYLANSPGAPFNSNDYIRKDSIPCWGCKLPQ